MIDFPANPTINQNFVAAGVTWRWDGVKWVGNSSTSLPYLPSTGGTITGSLNVTGNITAGGTATVGGLVDTGNASVSGGLTVGGTASFLGNASVSGTLTSGGITTGSIGATGNVTVGGSLLAGNTTVGALTASNGTINGNFFINGGNLLYMNGNPILNANPPNTGFNVFYDNSGQAAFLMGGAIGYYRQGNHYFQNNSGATTYAQFTPTGTYNLSGSWAVISDTSIKEVVGPYDRGLDAILALNPVVFQYKAGTTFARAASDAPLVGLLAHEVEPHIPEMVGKTTITIEEVEQEVDTLSPSDLLYVLINAVKELSARIAVLEAPPAP